MLIACYECICIAFVTVDGQWAAWQDSGSCSTTCGNGIQQLVRTCSLPTVAHGGRYCQGTDRGERSCNVQSVCPCKSNCHTVIHIPHFLRREVKAYVRMLTNREKLPRKSQAGFIMLRRIGTQTTFFELWMLTYLLTPICV